MPTVQRWGRNESLIWPPRTYLYTLSAFFLSLAATGLFVYVHFQFGFSPLERYYLPYYLRSEKPSLTHHASTYQLLYVSDGNSPARSALAADVRSGQTAQPTGAPLPLALSAQARQQGFRLLFREQPRHYPNQTFHAWLAQWIYDDVPLDRLFNTQLMLGLAALVLQLPFSIRKDIQRRKQLRYGRRLKGPILVSPRQFTKDVAGNGITGDRIKKFLRGPGASTVVVTMYRNKALMPFTIQRGVIPLPALDASYKVDGETGYIRINKFSRTTFEEFMIAMETLEKQGMKKLILDIRGNGGGIVDEAVNMADEFLGNDDLIVYNEGRKSPRKE